MSLLSATTLIAASAIAPFVGAAHQFLPDVQWRPGSAISADFTCQGHQEVALLGTATDTIVVAVFLNGPSNRPEVLRYSSKARNAATSTLSVEDGAQDPDAPPLPKGLVSGKCKGLRLDDGEVDAAHIYWDPDRQALLDWVR